MNQLKAIATAVKNKIKPKTELEYLKDQRLKVCNQCPLFSKTKGRSFCDGSKALLKTDKRKVISTSDPRYNQQEYKRGCGCTLISATLPEKPSVVGFNNTCPNRLWDKVEEELFMVDIKEEEEQDFILEPTFYITRNRKLATVRMINKEDLLNAGFNKSNNKFKKTLKGTKDNIEFTVVLDRTCTKIYVDDQELSNDNVTIEDINEITQLLLNNINDEN